MIDKFDGDFSFLSNFFECPVTFDGLTFGNSEAAYQAQKTLDVKDRMEFTTLTGGKAKRKGRKIQLRSDWDKVKFDIMYKICSVKFNQNPELAQRLLETGEEELVEGNTWNDRIWGVCNGQGMNMLGKILMRIRSELQKNQS